MRQYDPNTTYKYAHVKRDGHNLTVTIDDVGNLTCVTRLPTDITDQLRFMKIFELLRRYLPNGTVVQGELYYPGRPASYVKTAIKKKDTALRFEIFAELGVSKTWGLEKVELRVFPLPFTKFLCNPVGIPEFITQDQEGWVFKNGNLDTWAKWKPHKDIDLVVTGYVHGQGQHLGLIGAWRCSVWHGGKLHEVANAGGLTEDHRLEHSLCPEDYYGRVAEIRYQCVGSRGRLRHPRFIRWREDKAGQECTSTQDPCLYEGLSC